MIGVRVHQDVRISTYSGTLQIVLFEGAGEGVRLSSEDQYDTALAYLAEGYCSRRPQHVRTAHKLLAPLHNKMETGTGPQDIGKCMCRWCPLFGPWWVNITAMH